MTLSHETLVLSAQQWARQIAPKWTAGEVLTNLPTGALLKIGTKVYEIKVVERRNMGARR